MRKRTLDVIIFASAFGFVEAACVVYLRHLLGSAIPTPSAKEILFLVPGIAFLDPQSAVKIIADSAILNIERIREGATIIMLLAVSNLAANNIRQRVAYFLLSFGIWDLFYYLFLRLTIGWPKNLGDLDIFFLLPTPWIGPVLAPVAISSVFVIFALIYLSKKR